MGWLMSFVDVIVCLLAGVIVPGLLGMVILLTVGDGEPPAGA